jgi:hypothetical protein
MYAHDHNDRLPLNDPFEAIAPYLLSLTNKRVFNNTIRCPKAKKIGSYGYFRSSMGLDIYLYLGRSRNLPLVADSIEQVGGALINHNDRSCVPDYRHFNSYCVVYADGHVSNRTSLEEMLEETLRRQYHELLF